MNNVLIIYTDIMARGEYPTYIKRYFKEQNVVTYKEDGDNEILKQYTVDFISFSYYMSIVTTTNNNWKKTSRNLVIRILLNQMYVRYQLPIFIAENGLGAHDETEEDDAIHDAYCINYLKQYAEQMKEAILDDVEMIGYIM
ncbi:family 1 glycosylhydrolase [Carnobacterium sp.]|uniref:family 1 glycosylhydrolase n=1 Tax=Carnobacterium sp. TaxID=48221 RepID=UPI0028AD1148|nr:family 1 glycosylhydrolase [Carnobacterium sp.]